MDTVKSITERFEYGDRFMRRLTELHIKDIVAVIEKIWENSCTDFYNTIHNGELLMKEYSRKRTTVEYDSKLNIEKIKVCWDYWDSITIELTAFGIVATYKPEHGAYVKILDMSWVLIENLFFKN